MGIKLPPCIPKQSRIFKQSEHPYKVEITIAMSTSTTLLPDDASDPSDMTTVSYFLHPELKLPTLSEADTTATDTADSKGGDPGPACTDGGETDEAAVADAWEWADKCDESIHPFWAVRRMTKKQLAEAVFKATTDQTTIPRFNCQLSIEMISCVAMGVVQEQAVNVTRL